MRARAVRRASVLTRCLAIQLLNAQGQTVAADDDPRPGCAGERWQVTLPRAARCAALWRLLKERVLDPLQLVPRRPLPWLGQPQWVSGGSCRGLMLRPGGPSARIRAPRLHRSSEPRRPASSTGVWLRKIRGWRRRHLPPRSQPCVARDKPISAPVRSCARRR
jgi:hypothetical protein